MANHLTGSVRTRPTEIQRTGSARYGDLRGLQGVLWDMDGTIVDTEPYWIRAEKELVESYGGTWTTEQATTLVGQALEYSAGELQRAGVALDIRSIIEHLTDRVAADVRTAVPWRPGARELLSALRAEGVPCAMVTMSESLLAGEIAAQLPDGTFSHLVTGDRVSAGKPDPEAYQLGFDLLAADHPGLRKDRVVAIEDSLPGVTSALAAGLVTLAVPHFVPLPPDERRTDWDTLEGRTPADLAALLPEETGEDRHE
ncbi:HAD family hydrolase [Arthrobacter sedimenti]|uniref:HAD family hydrolase n=1 Tax=Arthrobacter sedimenti TaxID=2694931 RepID=UPI000B5825D0|nr:HAD family phosphatase [Arthrobacter sedimenti]OUM42497.1 haloacid dehalogenase [Arthrobacter agilis]